MQGNNGPQLAVISTRFVGNKIRCLRPRCFRINRDVGYGVVGVIQVTSGDNDDVKTV